MPAPRNLEGMLGRTSWEGTCHSGRRPALSLRFLITSLASLCLSTGGISILLLGTGHATQMDEFSVKFLKPLTPPSYCRVPIYSFKSSQSKRKEQIIFAKTDSVLRWGSVVHFVAFQTSPVRGEGVGCYARSKWIGLGVCHRGSLLYCTDEISYVFSDGFSLGIWRKRSLE